MFKEKDEGIVPVILSVNLSYKPCHCEVSLMQNGNVLEYFIWEEMIDMLTYITQVVARYPGLLLVLVTDLETDLCSLADLFKQCGQQSKQGVQRQDTCLYDFLREVSALPIKCLHLPAVKYVLNVPLYRKRFFPTMGSPRAICALATLLYRMRQQDADWTEMTFFYLELQHTSYTVVVVKDGTVVDGVKFDVALQFEQIGSQSQEQRADLLEAAFWERLTRDLAGLMAIHHIEEIVLRDEGNDRADMQYESSSNAQPIRVEEAIDRLGDSYKLYQFPQEGGEQPGCEIAFGAWLLTGGFLSSGHAAEPAQRLISTLFLSAQFDDQS
jgi:hypothetical protein